MTAEPTIDVHFDFKSEIAQGQDADSVSPTLRRYHQLLWSKPLRSGAAFEVHAPLKRRDGYLIGSTVDRPEACFGSDAITHSYSTWKKPKPLAVAVAELDEDQRRRYLFPPYTVGSAMIWPVRSANRPTINQARGTRGAIADRIDLTLECIRLHYMGLHDSPLADVLTSYKDFFALFDGFSEFVEFFHFQPLVSSDSSAIKFFIPFENFERHGSPNSVDEYVAYREATLEFIAARQSLIGDWAAEHLPGAE